MEERDATYERLFREVFRRSGSAMVLADDDGRYVEANPAALRLLRYDPEDLIGKTVLDIVAPEDREDLAQEIALGLASEETADEGMRTFITGDGRKLRLHYCRSLSVVDGLHLAVYLTPVEAEDEPESCEVHVGTPTPREVEVIGLLALGITGEEIAERLVLSPATIRTHIRNAMEKLGASTRAQLIAIAARERLISL